MSATVKSLTPNEPNVVIPLSEYTALGDFKLLVEALGITDITSLSIGDLVKLRRVLANQSISQLAESSGIDRGSLSKIEDNLVAVQHRSIEKFKKPFGDAFVKYITNLKNKIG